MNQKIKVSPHLIIISCLNNCPYFVDSETAQEPNPTEDEGEEMEKSEINGPIEESEDSSGSSFEELNH